jgi:hypothetical protein
MRFHFVAQGPCNDKDLNVTHVSQWFELQTPEKFGLARSDARYTAHIHVPRTDNRWFMLQEFSIEQLLWVCAQNNHSLQFLYCAI